VVILASYCKGLLCLLESGLSSSELLLLSSSFEDEVTELEEELDDDELESLSFYGFCISSFRRSFLGKNLCLYSSR
jgi:hypothetical protein